VPIAELRERVFESTRPLGILRHLPLAWQFIVERRLMFA